jgi:hypothetical protein
VARRLKGLRTLDTSLYVAGLPPVSRRSGKSLGNLGIYYNACDVSTNFLAKAKASLVLGDCCYFDCATDIGIMCGCFKLIEKLFTPEQIVGKLRQIEVLVC